MEKVKDKPLLSFEPHSLFRDIFRNLWAILLAVLIGFMGAYIVERSVYSPVYTSSAVLIVRVKTGSYQAYTNLNASTEMAEIFTNVFVQPAMRQYAAENIGASAFDGSISASTVPNTNMLNVRVTADAPEKAYSLLCSVLEVYPQISDTIFSNAVIDVISTPRLPRSPSNPMSQMSRLLIILLCGGGALGAIVLLSLLRDTVKKEADFHAKIDGRLLGSIAHEKKHAGLKARILGKKRAPLIDHAFASFRFTESYYKIASRLEYLHRTRGAKVFLLTSAVENEGKSTAAANLAIALAKRGNRVLLLDMDFIKPALHRILDTPVPKQGELGSLLSGSLAPGEYRLLRYRKSGLFLALNAQRHPDYVDWISGGMVGELLDAYRERADYIIIDTPPMAAAADVCSMLPFADACILMVQTDRAQSADVNDALLRMGESGGNLAGCILNNVYPEFSLFGQAGLDESGYYGRKYGAYGSYRNYARYSAGRPAAGQGAAGAQAPAGKGV